MEYACNTLMILTLVLFPASQLLLLSWMLSRPDSKYNIVTRLISYYGEIPITFICLASEINVDAVCWEVDWTSILVGLLGGYVVIVGWKNMERIMNGLGGVWDAAVFVVWRVGIEVRHNIESWSARPSPPMEKAAKDDKLERNED